MRTSSNPRLAVLLVCCLLLVAAAVIMSGCGNSATDTAAPVSTGPTPQTHTAASGPAISDKLSFDQLTLESPAETEKDKNGLTFLRFKYADNDGKVYECVLPKAMSEGQYTLAEWSSTFSAYRLPKVVAVKKVSSKVNIGDYPFISPKPRQQQTNTDSNGQQLPSPDSGPAGSPPPAPGVPGVGAGAPP